MLTNTIIICKPTPNSILAILRSLILLLEGYRVGCRHSLYYSMKNILSVFCDYTNKLKSIFTKILQLNIFKDPNINIIKLLLLILKNFLLQTLYNLRFKSLTYYMQIPQRPFILIIIKSL